MILNDDNTLKIEVSDDVIEEIEINSSKNLIYIVKQDKCLDLTIYLSATVVSFKIVFDLKKNARANVVLIDTSKGKLDLSANVTMNEEKSSFEWCLASISNNDDDKKIDVSIDQIVGRTTAHMYNYGVVLSNGRLSFAGVGKIYPRANGAKVSQVAKIINYDERAFSSAKPILSIDCDDVVAMHSASVGKVDENALFYLQSRGLKESDAKALLTLAHLSPAIEKIKDEVAKERVIKEIKELL